MRILLAEDTSDIAEAILGRLLRLGHRVDWETDGAVADEMLAIQDYDLIVLDVMLPGMDGVQVLRNFRARGGKSPVLVLTAVSEVERRVDALELGADDYLTKPFDFREFEARARALLRRGVGSVSNIIRCGPLTIDTAARTALVGDRALRLTRRELSILEALARRPEKIFSKQELIDNLFTLDSTASENAIEQYVMRLRRKLEDAGVDIRTIRGLGYQIVKP